MMSDHRMGDLKMSYLISLHCSECERKFDPDQLQTFCPDCNAPLMADYDLENARQNLNKTEFYTRPHGMWRWRELLPVKNPEFILDLGEGDTPQLKMDRLGANLGLKQLYVKDESQNPTGSFKARGLAAAVSKAKELGVEKVIIPTAGNAGGAMAAYAARGGMQACIYMPKDTPKANIEESIITGAEVNLVDGLISDAAALAAERSRKEGWFDVSTFKEPYRTEGKKIMGYELAETFGWELPEVIIYPTGGGTGLVGMVKAFQEMQAMGWLTSAKMPRMVAVQSSGCAPVVSAFQSGKDRCDFWEKAETIASGLRVPKSFADRQILRDLRDTHGTAVAVSDTSISEAQKLLAQAEGIFAAPEGAATLAALIILRETNWIEIDERVVLFNTGTGLKYI